VIICGVCPETATNTALVFCAFWGTADSAEGEKPDYSFAAWIWIPLHPIHIKPYCLFIVHVDCEIFDKK
jgi:hypothetical protein